MYIDEGLDRTVWDKYSGDDKRGNVDSTDEDMFAYSDAFPYCEPPPSGTSIFDHIVCS